MKRRGLDTHPHTDQIKSSLIADGVRVNLVRCHTIYGTGRGIEGEDRGNQTNGKMLQKPGLVILRWTIRAIFGHRVTDIKARHAQTEKRRKNSDLGEETFEGPKTVSTVFFLDLLGGDNS